MTVPERAKSHTQGTSGAHIRETSEVHSQETSEAGRQIWSLTGQGEHMGASPLAPRMCSYLLVLHTYCYLADSVKLQADRQERTVEEDIADIEVL